MLRITSSSLEFSASQTDAKVVSDVQNLNDFMPSTIAFRPTALTVSGGPIDSTITCTEVVLKSAKNPELAHRLYKGPAVPVQDVLGAFSRDALRNGSLTPYRFPVDHGVQLEVTYSSGGTAFSGTLLWDIDNPSQVEGEIPEGLANAIQDKVGLGKAREILFRSGGNAFGLGHAPWAPAEQ